jgi:UDPglucose--hexose-1-phosphate uridylyltransferase
MTEHLTTASRVRRTSTTLADGRELIYFDDSEPYLSGARTRDVLDERPLMVRPGAGAIRLDALTGDWVSIADHRQDRTFLPPADECPLCPSGGGTMPSEIPDRRYDVVVFENRFPSFAGGGSPAGPPSLPETVVSPLLAHGPALGRCEVVCFTSDHDTSFSSLSAQRARTVVDVWADRTAELSAMEGVEQVFIFENRGQEIGVTLHHPHGQIYAYPFVPSRTASLLRQATEQPSADRPAAGCGRARRRAGCRVESRHQGCSLDRLRPVCRPVAGRGAPGPQP